MFAGDTPSEVNPSVHVHESRCFSSFIFTGQLSTSSPRSEYSGTQDADIPPVVAHIMSASAGAAGEAGLKVLSRTPASSCISSNVDCGITVNIPIVILPFYGAKNSAMILI